MRARVSFGAPPAAGAAVVELSSLRGRCAAVVRRDPRGGVVSVQGSARRPVCRLAPPCGPDAGVLSIREAVCWLRRTVSAARNRFTVTAADRACAPTPSRCRCDLDGWHCARPRCGHATPPQAQAARAPAADAPPRCCRLHAAQTPSAERGHGGTATMAKGREASLRSTGITTAPSVERRKWKGSSAPTVLAGRALLGLGSRQILALRPPITRFFLDLIALPCVCPLPPSVQGTWAAVGCPELSTT